MFTGGSLARRCLSPLLVVPAIVACVLVLAPRAGMADTDWRTWERYMDSGQRALDQGRPASAGSWFLRAVQEVERLDSRDARLGESLRKLLDVYRKQGRQDDVLKIEERLAALPPAATAPTGVAEALDAFVLLLREMGRTQEARAVASAAARARPADSRGGDEGLLVDNPLFYLRKYSELLQARGRADEAQRIVALSGAVARDLAQRYTRLRQKLVRDPPLLLSLTHGNLLDGGIEAFSAGLYAEAQAFFVEAVKIAGKLPSGDVTLAYTESLLAETYAAQGKRAEFDQAARRAMPVFERTGLTHDLVVRGLRLLALAHLRYDFEPLRAEAHLARSLRIIEKDLAPDHPTVGLHRAGLAATSLALHGFERARPQLEQALAIAGRQYLPEHFYLAHGLGRVAKVAADRGDYLLAHVVAGRVVEIVKRMLDPGHPEVVVAMETQRELREKLGRPAERVTLAAKTTVALEVAGNAPVVHGTVNRTQRAALIVDPDATTTVIRPLVLSRLGVTIPDGTPRQKLYVGGGRMIDVALVTLASLQLGDATIEHVDVAIGDATPGNADLDGLLGGDLLQRFRFTIDKSARRLILEPLGP